MLKVNRSWVNSGGLLVQAILHNPVSSIEHLSHLISLAHIISQNLPFNPFNTTTLTQTPLGFFGAFTQPRHLLASDDPVKRDTNTASFDIDNVPLQTIRVNAVTTNGPLSIFYHQDPGVRLFSKCSTTNGLVFVQHDPSWQGSFLVRSLNGLMRVPDITSLSAQQTSVSTPADPWGLNRQQAIGFSHGSSEPYYLNGTLLSDPGVQYGISRGDAVFNDLIQSWVSWKSSLELVDLHLIHSISQTRRRYQAWSTGWTATRYLQASTSPLSPTTSLKHVTERARGSSFSDHHSALLQPAGEMQRCV